MRGYLSNPCCQDRFIDGSCTSGEAEEVLELEKNATSSNSIHGARGKGLNLFGFDEGVDADVDGQAVDDGFGEFVARFQ